MTKPKRTPDTAPEAPGEADNQQETPALGSPVEPEPQETMLEAPPTLAPTPAQTPIQTEPPRPAQTPGPAGPSLGKRLWRAAVFLFNLVLILLLVSVIAAAVYIGWPIVYDRYVLPVENHTAQIAQIERDRDQNRVQVNALQTQVAAMLADRSNQAGAIIDLSGRVVALEGTQTALQNMIATQSSQLAALEAAQAALQANNLEMNAELDRQIKLLHGMELLSRGRLFLYQSNFGLAKQDIQAARDILAALPPAPVEPAGGGLKEVLDRLDLCLSRLPDFPVPASMDLDIAWQILLQIPVQPLENATPTAVMELVEPTLPPEATPTGPLEITPEATPTNVIDSTPTEAATPTATIQP